MSTLHVELVTGTGGDTYVALNNSVKPIAQSIILTKDQALDLARVMIAKFPEEFTNERH